MHDRLRHTWKDVLGRTYLEGRIDEQFVVWLSPKCELFELHVAFYVDFSVGVM